MDDRDKLAQPGTSAESLLAPDANTEILLRLVQLDEAADAPVDLFVHQKLAVCGGGVVVEDRFGIKLTEFLGK